MPSLGLPWLSQLLLCLFELLEIDSGTSATAGGGPSGGGYYTDRSQLLSQLRQLPLLPTTRGGWVSAAPAAATGSGGGRDASVFFTPGTADAGELQPEMLERCGLMLQEVSGQLDFLQPDLLAAAPPEKLEVLRRGLHMLGVRPVSADHVLRLYVVPKMIREGADMAPAQLAACLAWPLVSGLLNAAAGAEPTTAEHRTLQELRGSCCVDTSAGVLRLSALQEALFLPPEITGDLHLCQDFAAVRRWVVIKAATYRQVLAVSPAAWRWLFTQLGATALLPLQPRVVHLTHDQKRDSCWSNVPFPRPKGAAASLEPAADVSNHHPDNSAQPAAAEDSHGDHLRDPVSSIGPPGNSVSVPMEDTATQSGSQSAAWQVEEQACPLLEEIVRHIASPSTELPTATLQVSSHP